MTGGRGTTGRGRRRQPSSIPVAAVPAFGLVALFTTAGLVGVAHGSLRQGVVGGEGVGLDAWRRTFADPAFGDAVAFTSWVAAASTLLAVAAAVPVALVLRRAGPLGRTSLSLPVASPHLVAAALAAAWLAPGGLADRLIGGLPVELTGDRLGLGIILVYTWKETPFLALLALTALDPATTELEETAAMLGAGRRHRLRDVILPRLVLPLAGGGLLVAAFVIGAVEVPLVIGPTRPRVLGTYALGVVRLDGPLARADAAVANLVAAALVAVVGLLLAVGARRRRRPVAR